MNERLQDDLLTTRHHLVSFGSKAKDQAIKRLSDRLAQSCGLLAHAGDEELASGAEADIREDYARWVDAVAAHRAAGGG